MKKVNRKQIQGMLILGYQCLPFAHYLFLGIDDASAFKSWLKTVEFQDGSSSPKRECMNIAFTSKGLQKLDLVVTEENGFSGPFIEGMDREHRNRILGDIGANGSARWNWGRLCDEDDLHCVLILFARDKSRIDTYYEDQATKFSKYGISEILIKIESVPLGRMGRKEHFGFRDGISQPVMRGLDWDASESNFVNPGEFIFGYRNNYDKYPLCPYLKKHKVDFGYSGSYMVYRQLEQDVSLFWKTMCSYFQDPQTGKDEAVALASKMVGRWPNGNPLTRKPSDNITDGDLRNFGFYDNDRLGTKCPLGSHIRRSNPRDSLSNSGEKEGIADAYRASNNHRILRRGRPYGPPLVSNLEIEEILEVLNSEQSESRGLNFICFNTDIARQFEFVQHTWANNRTFHGLYNDVDPIIGVQRTVKNEMEDTQFEVQANPVRKRYKNVPAFIRVKGGAYFFMPGLEAIEFLAK